MRIVAICCLVASAAFAAPKITAKTTGLYPSKTCKTKIKGGDGEDPVLRCPAMKGYDVEVSFAAIDTFVVVTGESREVKFSGNVGSRMEWRIADGKPFALLVEVADNDTDDNGAPITKNARIEVRGLGGRSTELRVEIANKAAAKKAWAAARVLADKTL